MRRTQGWLSWERSEDYYSEGQLLWLDADTLIRQQSGGRKSLDDFAHAFFGVNDGSYVTSTYTFEDIVNALNGVQAHDWGAFLRSRLDGHGPGAPLDGISRGGYKLVYTDTPTNYFRDSETRRRVNDLTYSLGVVVQSDGRIADVLWDGPAFKNGFTVGAQIVAVDGVAYDGERLKETIKSAKNSKAAMEMLVKTGDRYRMVRMDYHDGLRYPRLERNGSAPTMLDAILTPKN
jgi:predicted metalloprotease with PDZ domain